MHVELVEPSGTVAYNARGGRATWSARVDVGAGGSLTWRSAPFIVASDTGEQRDAQQRCHPRHGEYLSVAGHPRDVRSFAAP